MDRLTTYNNNNWGLNLIKIGKTLTWRNIVGCNQQIRNDFEQGAAYTYMFIPREYVDDFIFNQLEGFGIQNVIEISNAMNLPCELVNPEEIEEAAKWKGSKVDFFYGSAGNLNFEDFYTIKISGNGKSKLPYYIFCFLRILYYQNQNTVEFFKRTREAKSPLEYFQVLYDLNMSGSNSLMYTGKNSDSIGNYQINSQILELLEKTGKDVVIEQLMTVNPSNFLGENEYFCVPIDTSTRTYSFQLLKERKHFLEAPVLNLFFFPKEKGDNYTLTGRSLVAYTCTNYPTKNPTSSSKISSVNFINMYKKVEVPVKITGAQVLSRHPSHEVFRKNPNLRFPVKTLIRLGSTTVPSTKFDVEINSVESIQKSANKLLMKEAFDAHGVATADWFTYEIDSFFPRGDVGNKPIPLADMPYPIIMKNIYGSRGEGNTKCDTPEQLQAAMRKAKDLKNYIFEKFYNFAKEYRLHVSILGVFLVWRKLRKSDTPEDQRWYFNNANCNWVSPAHELFDCPVNMVEAKEEALKALKAVGLTIGGVDLRIQTKGTSPKFIVVEINSACSQAELTAESYVAEFNKIVNELSKKKF